MSTPNPTLTSLHELLLQSDAERLALKAALEKQFASEQMLRTILDTIPQRVFWKNIHGVYLGCNQPLAQDCGYQSPSQMVGRTDADTTSAEIAELYRADDRWVIEHDLPRLNYDEPQVRADGSTGWLRTSKVPLHDMDGQVIGILGTYEDITDRKRAEHFRTSQNQVLESMARGEALEKILIRIVLLVESQAAGLLGSIVVLHHDGNASGIVAAPSLPTPNPLHACGSIPILSQAGDPLGTFALFSRDPRVPAADELRTVEVAVRMAAIAIERTRTETALQKADERFLQAQKMDAFGQLAGGIAHDFNNLLTVMIASLDLMRTADLAESERKQAVTDCAHAAERAAHLTSQLLTFSRRRQMQMAPVDLNDVTGHAAQLLQRIIGEHIQLETRLRPGGAFVKADATLLEQAIMNLAVNSRDAMPQGGRLVLETAEVDMGEQSRNGRPIRPGAYIRLSVSDTGTGISAEDLPHIFEPFYTTKKEGEGTGLGLATVFAIIEQHGGWVEVESAPLRGTTLSLFLPKHAQAVSVEPAPPRALPGPGGTETVLLVEDEPEVRCLMTRLLEHAGYRVFAAESGLAALPLWATIAKDVDLLFTDMIMPGGFGGKELANRLRTEKPGLKVILCSGYAESVPAQNRHDDLAAHFLQKPFDASALLCRVRECLDAPALR